MSLVSIGDIMAVTVDSMYIDNGNVVLVVSDKAGVEYTMQIGQGQGRPASRPQAAQEAPGWREAGQGQGSGGPGPQEASQPPSRADVGGQDQAPEAPAVEKRPNEFAHPDEIALWLASHPEDLRKFAPRLSLRKRQLITDGIIELLDVDQLEGARHALEKFSAIEPPPEFSDGRAVWGYEGSPVAAELHEGNVSKLLARQATEHANVNESLANVPVAAPKGDTLTAAGAAKEVKNWGDTALG